MSEGPRSVQIGSRRRAGHEMPRRRARRRRWSLVVGLVLGLVLPASAALAMPGSPAAAFDDTTVREPGHAWSIVAADGSRLAVSSWVLSTSGDTVEELEPVPAPRSSESPAEVPRRLAVGMGDRPDATVRAISRIGAVPSSTGPHLVMRSGDRLPGRPDLVEGELVWRHGWLGDFAVDLDGLRSIVLTPDAPSPAAVDADVVTLANGDRLEGFVVELGVDVVVERIEDGSTRRVPFERVARIDLVVDSQAGAPIRMWTRDGTSIALDGLRGTRGDGDDDESRLVAFSRRGGVGRGRSEGVVFARELVAVAWRPGAIEPLSTLDWTMSPHGEAMDRSWIPAPVRIDEASPFGAATIEMTGPARFEARVPPGSILSASVELPPLMRRFGDLELRILDGDRERWRRDFSAISPQATIAIPIETGRLAIELGPGLRGPVQDRLRFTLPMLLRPDR